MGCLKTKSMINPIFEAHYQFALDEKDIAALFTLKTEIRYMSYLIAKRHHPTGVKLSDLVQELKQWEEYKEIRPTDLPSYLKVMVRDGLLEKLKKDGLNLYKLKRDLTISLEVIDNNKTLDAFTDNIPLFLQQLITKKDAALKLVLYYNLSQIYKKEMELMNKPNRTPEETDELCNLRAARDMEILCRIYDFEYPSKFIEFINNLVNAEIISINSKNNATYIVPNILINIEQHELRAEKTNL
ncbi:MAG: hypothetical protein ACFFCD_07425 [Promethearchaeota archaeon]